MQNINIICMGKLTNKFYQDAVSEYVKRTRLYCNITIKELAPKQINEKSVSSATIEKALQDEADLILKNIKKGEAIVAMCIEGEQISSEELASYISSRAISGCGDINFVIGSSFGLANTLKTAADKRLSMSKMTFAHELARVMLCEQIYRAFSILNNGKYHK